jgi:hypothetical protein
MRLNSAVLLMLSGYAYAGCANSDSDQRNLCYAKKGASCKDIRNSDLQAQKTRITAGF